MRLAPEAATAGIGARFDIYVLLFTAAVSAAALFLAAFGLYGVISYSVVLRTRDFGIRMALGAGPRAVLFGVLGQALRLTGTGIAAGLAGSLLLNRAFQSLLFEVSRSIP